jgi:transposase
MSTSLLYHAFGIRGYQYTRTDYQDGQVIFTIHQEPETFRCSACGGREVHPRSHVVRRFRSLPIGSRATAVILPIPRVECRACGVVRQVEVPFADPRRTYTRAFERYALELSRSMTIRDVARHLDVGWDTIKEIQKRDLSRRFARPKLKHLRRIAIDEIAVAKGHRYLTVVMDLESGAVVFVGDGKGGRRAPAVLEAAAAQRGPDRSGGHGHVGGLPGGGRDPPAQGEVRFRPLSRDQKFNDKLSDMPSPPRHTLSDSLVTEV